MWRLSSFLSSARAAELTCYTGLLGLTRDRANSGLHPSPIWSPPRLPVPVTHLSPGPVTRGPCHLSLPVTHLSPITCHLPLVSGLYYKPVSNVTQVRITELDNVAAAALLSQYSSFKCSSSSLSASSSSQPDASQHAALQHYANIASIFTAQRAMDIPALKPSSSSHHSLLQALLIPLLLIQPLNQASTTKHAVSQEPATNQAPETEQPGTEGDPRLARQCRAALYSNEKLSYDFYDEGSFPSPPSAADPSYDATSAREPKLAGSSFPCTPHSSEQSGTPSSMRTYGQSIRHSARTELQRPAPPSAFATYASVPLDLPLILPLDLPMPGLINPPLTSSQLDSQSVEQVRTGCKLESYQYQSPAEPPKACRSDAAISCGGSSYSCTNDSCQATSSSCVLVSVDSGTLQPLWLASVGFVIDRQPAADKRPARASVGRASVADRLPVAEKPLGHARVARDSKADWQPVAVKPPVPAWQDSMDSMDSVDSMGRWLGAGASVADEPSVLAWQDSMDRWLGAGASVAGKPPVPAWQDSMDSMGRWLGDGASVAGKPPVPAWQDSMDRWLGAGASVADKPQVADKLHIQTKASSNSKGDDQLLTHMPPAQAMDRFTPTLGNRAAEDSFPFAPSTDLLMLKDETRTAVCPSCDDMTSSGTEFDCTGATDMFENLWLPSKDSVRKAEIECDISRTSATEFDYTGATDMFENLCLPSKDSVRKVGLMEKVFCNMQEIVFYPDIIDELTEESIVFNDTGDEKEEEDE
eukprot:gene29277-12520_t